MAADVAVIGGGAAGLAAAVRCAEALGGRRVIVFEKGDRVGRKLLASGSGTCNLSNIRMSAARYHGAPPSFVAPVLEKFSPDDAISFFSSLGILCAPREDGRIYPICAQSSAVLDGLRLALSAREVPVRCKTPVTAIIPSSSGVILQAGEETLTAKAALVACGGAASPKLGGGTDGFSLLTALGHTKSPLFPALVPLKFEHPLRAVKGVRVQASLCLTLNEKLIRTAKGEVLFTDDGLSGPAAMELGRDVADWERKKQGNVSLSIDFLPQLSFRETHEEIKRRCALPGRTGEHLLTGLVQTRLGQMLVKASGISLNTPAKNLSAAECRIIANALKKFNIPISGTLGWATAQATAGGIETSQFDPLTMRSKLCRHVYAAGEILNVDGDCGGYNLHWAWASAYTAAQAMIREVSK